MTLRLKEIQLHFSYLCIFRTFIRHSQEWYFTFEREVSARRLHKQARFLTEMQFILGSVVARQDY